jgi:hypothetical protein
MINLVNGMKDLIMPITEFLNSLMSTPTNTTDVTNSPKDWEDFWYNEEITNET